MTKPLHPLIAEILAAMSGTQTDAAARAGIAQAHLSQIAGGKRLPTLPVIERLAEAAGLELRLVKRKRPKTDPVTQTESQHDQAQKRGQAGEAAP